MGLILILIISVVIFITYHKVMNVWYFSFKAFILEIITILIISSFLTMILISLLTFIGSILGKLLTIILSIVKWGIIIGIIFLIGVFIKNIFFKYKNKIDINSDNDLKLEGDNLNE